MPRNILYPEGSEQLRVTVPRPVKEGLRTVASRQRLSVAQVVTIALEDYLRRRGDLPVAERREVPA